MTIMRTSLVSVSFCEKLTIFILIKKQTAVNLFLGGTYL
jgi:hypothetical protein